MGLLPLLAVAALAKKPKEAPAPPRPTVPDPALPAGEVAAPNAPKLTGQDVLLAMKGLDRDTFRFTLAADTAALAALDPAAVDAVFAAFAADPDWRVTRDAGGRVAWKRDPDAGHVVGVDGWHVAGDTCWRVGVREANAVEPEWTSSANVARAPVGTARIEIRGFRPDGTACAALASAVRIEGPVAIEIFESGPVDGRPVTTAALGAIPHAVADAVGAAEALRTQGHDALALPDGEPLKITAPTLTIAAGGPGTVVVRARVNPGEAGWAWVRILRDGVPWEEARVGAATVEQPGWSRDPAHGFYLQATVPLPTGAAFPATAEVWFQGADGRPRRLLAETVEVPAR